MKKYGTILLMILFVGLLLITGCARKEETAPGPAATAQPVPDAQATPFPGADATPEPTPTPTPTPVPYEVAADAASVTAAYASGYEEAAEVLRAANSAPPDAWDTVFDGLTEPAAPELHAVRLLDQRPVSDTVCADGTNLYILSGKELSIFRADGAVEQLLSTTEVGVDWTGQEKPGNAPKGYEKTPLSLVPCGDRLAVISDWYGYSGGARALAYSEYTVVDIYDISDPASPVLLFGFGQDGSVASVGLFGTTLYLLTDVGLFEEPDAAAPERFVPRVYTQTGEEMLTADKILLGDGGYYGFTVIGACDLTTLQRDTRAFLGMAPDVYARDGSLFFLSPRWVEGTRTVTESDGSAVTENVVTECTQIYRFEIGGGGIALGDTGLVNGAVPDSSALDYRNGIVRTAGTLRQGLYTRDESGNLLWRELSFGTRVTWLDPQLRRISAADRPGGEDPITWAGFLNGSVVLTGSAGGSLLLRDDAPEPALLSDAVRAEAILPWGEQGYMAFYRPEDGKLTLSVRDLELRELSSRTFGSDHSNTLENQASYLSDGEINVFAFAADDSYCLYGYDEVAGLMFRADVFLTDWAWNSRGFHVGGRLYVADSKELIVLDAGTLEKIGSFVL